MLSNINLKIKKLFIHLILTLIFVGSLIPHLNVVHAQNNPDNTNGVQAATLEWIRNTAFDIVSLYIARSWPIELENSDLHWRENQVIDTDGNEKIIPDGEYRIKSSIDTNVVVDLSEDKSGATTLAWQNYSLPNQRWNFIYDSTKQAYKIESSQNSKLLLTWESRSGNRVMGYQDEGNRDQYWRIERTNDGYYKLRNYEDSRKVIDLTAGNTANSTPIQVYNDHGSKNQKWTIEQTNTPFIPDGIYNISTKLNYKKVIDHDEHLNIAMIYDYLYLPTNEWKFEYEPGKQAYKIRSVKYQNLGLYYTEDALPISLNNVDTTNTDSRSYWAIEYDNQKGGYAIRSVSHPYQLLDLKYSKLTNKNEIITKQPTFNKNQLWNIVPRNSQASE